MSIVICLMGPTASGKTALAEALVARFPLEIISVDSAMIYRGMDVGTAKPDAVTLTRAPHHLIDILDPIEAYSAARFCDDAVRLCHEIHQRGKIPLCVGGTMMYFKALQQGLSLLPEADASVRSGIMEAAKEKGWPAMHDWLTEVDPKAASKIHVNDIQRIQRALEVYRLTGKPLTDYFQNQADTQHGLRFENILLMPSERSWLHERIALRFNDMLLSGLIEEVQRLVARWSLTLSHPAMRSIGYRQVFSFLQGVYGASELRHQGIAATRQLAKRQLTWLRHWPSGLLYTADHPKLPSEIMAIVDKILDNKDVS